jgi:hypothetical protein
MSEESTVKVAVLEQKVIDLKEIVLKLEEAIERINDVNSNITKMLAVHEQRINTNEENSHNIYQKVWEISEKQDTDKIELLDKINKLGLQIKGTRNKFLIAYAFVLFLGFVIQNAAFFENVLELGQTKKTHLTNPAEYGRLL